VSVVRAADCGAAKATSATSASVATSATSVAIATGATGGDARAVEGGGI